MSIAIRKVTPAIGAEISGIDPLARPSRAMATIDSRPSDALAIALRLDCPIFVDDTVLKSSKLDASVSDKENEKELRRWLENLNDEDMGRYKM